MKDFKKELAAVPPKPGSYQMLNKDGVIIYVGKAKNLQKRLKSYFNKIQTGKTKLLVDEIDHFEYIVTSTELESLILEITLIKKYNPKYNILLKDDKTYPYIELTKEKYPRLKVVRNTKRKRSNNHLFGPYPNVNAARTTVDILNRLYPLRKCDKLKKDLCLYYHINECLGYCKYDIPSEEILKMTKEITSFLKGDAQIIIKKIEEEMYKASDSLNYEKAKKLKDDLESVRTTLNKQKIDLNNNYSFDLINYYIKDNYLSLQVFFVRNGLLVGRHEDITAYVSADDIIEYIIKFYEANPIMPKEILVPHELNTDLIANYFSVIVKTPKKGKLFSLLKLARENALLKLDKEMEKRKLSDQLRIDAVNDLKKLLNMDRVSKIETFDNSHLFGSFYVGAMCSFNDFAPNKNEYRKYRLDLEKSDDMAAMREVLYRRYYKVLMENLDKPDLIVVDGGRGQIKICKEIISSLGLDIKIIGLVKNDKHRTSAIMNDSYEILEIPKNSNLFLFLTKMQDEVHRFAITYHRNIKSKGMLSSLLDFVPGIGEVSKKELLKKFGSLKKMKEAKIEELSEVVKKTTAEKLFSYLRKM